MGMQFASLFVCQNLPPLRAIKMDTAKRSSKFLVMNYWLILRVAKIQSAY